MVKKFKKSESPNMFNDKSTTLVTNGRKDTNIVNFINRSNFQTIKYNLLNLIYNQRRCEEILGEGVMGIVYTPTISKFEEIYIKDEIISLPIAVKKAKNSDDILIELIKKDLYIYSYKNLTIETIILAYVNELWYNKISPNVPLMIDYSSCYNDKNYIDKIINEKYGLDSSIEILLTGLDQSYLLHPYKYGSIFSSNLNTLSELLHYIIFSDNDGKVKLPNNIVCDICELYDYITISFIHTYNLLIKHNIHVFDVHFNNIFIYWLSDKSYMGNQNIGDIETIIYKIKNKMYKIKTFGFLIKIGDFGASIVIPKKNIIILGQANNIRTNYKLVDELIKYNFGLTQFITNTRILPINYLKNIVLYQILTLHPYNLLTHLMYNMSYSILDKLLSPGELLNYFSMYEIKELKNNKTTLIVNEY